MMTWLPAALWVHLWQSTWFVAVVWLATLALRQHRARLRYWLWTAASVKFLVPFSWLVRVGGLFEWHSAPLVVRPAATLVMTEVFAPSRLDVAPSVAPTSTIVPWLLASVWVIGALTNLFWWWRQWLPVRAALRGATTAALGCDSGGLIVKESHYALEPAVVGVRRPVLLVPVGLVARLTPAQTRALVAHERCHVHAHDNLAAAIHMAVETIFWFHPLVWWIAARQMDERERGCDEAVLRDGSAPADYAESILTVCRWSLASPLMCVSGITGSDLRTRIEWIMANRIGRRLNTIGRVVIALGIVAMLGGPIALGLSARAQSAQERRASFFDVVSVKPNHSGTLRDGMTREPGGRLVITNMQLWIIIRNAYGLERRAQITGGSGSSDWIWSDRFDITARTDKNPDADHFNQMVQALLADRFKLVVHQQTEEQPVYALVVGQAGKRGLSAIVSPPCDDPDTSSQGTVGASSANRLSCGFRMVPGHMVGVGVTMDRVARNLAIFAGRTVVDRTGLHGTFNVNLDWTPDQLPPPPDAWLQSPARAPEFPGVDPNGSSLFTAVREQLGLKLESTKAPVDILVIDHVEKPAPD